MNRIKQWWFNDLSRWVKFVFLVLMANGLPAFLILMSLPAFTEYLFVWTIKPEINARLVGVMYSNALILVGIGALQTRWSQVRIVMVVITLFSLLATTLTFFYLPPFLAHPWYHLAYWLTMYLILFFAAPYVFWTHEKKYGGKLPVQVPLHLGAKLVIIAALIMSFILGTGLLFAVEQMNQLLPWTVPPLVGGLIGVLFMTHTAAYSWALWDGDWLRVRPMFWQAIPTTLLFMLLPLVHADQLSDTGPGLWRYYLWAGFLLITHLALIIYYRALEKK